jgi:hypothetical protein
VKKIAPIFLILSSINAYAQTSLGVETQGYPAGITFGMRLDVMVTEDLNVTSRFGYNRTNRRDWGKNDTEKGEGLGFSIGVEKQNILIENLFLHIRADFWFLEIAWSDFDEELYEEQCTGPLITLDDQIQCTAFTRGSSDIIVFQPTVGVGYRIDFENQTFLKPGISFGWEQNIKTDGKEVGQGPILLGGFVLGFDL